MSCADAFLNQRTLILLAVSAAFHYACFYPLARKMVRSRGYEHRNVPRLALYMTAGPFLTSTIFVIGNCEASDAFKLPLAVGAPTGSFVLWTSFIIRSGPSPWTISRGISIFLSFPFLGALIALLWLLFSCGLDELVGLGPSGTQGRRPLIMALLIFLIFGLPIMGVHFGLL